jgi:hypothetical protein
MCEAIPPLPQYSLMAWCLVEHRDSFTFTFKTGKVAGGWRILHNEELVICMVHHIIRVVRSSRMRWVHGRDEKCIHTSAGEPEVDRKIILEWILGK